MPRRLICMLLAALILLSLISSAILPVLAATTMTTSDECVEILKALEGFIKKPVYDNGQYSVGYGSGCDKDDYPNGITEEEAEELLRKYLKSMEKSLNSFADRYGLTFTQYEFDALMLFTYNCGPSWITSESEIRQAVINGVTGNDFLYPFTRWSYASGSLNVNLARRRLIEANLFLNGDYSNTKPSYYNYVLYDSTGGTSGVEIQGYDSRQNSLVRPTPTMSGYRFLGWYTAEDGGSWVTRLDASHAGKTLYAHWQRGNVTTGVYASYQLNTNQLSSLSVHNSPNSVTVTRTLTAGTTVKIIADHVDGSNVKWGKLDKGGWVKLGNPLIGTASTGSEEKPVEVTVTNSYINVRGGAGAAYAQVGTVSQGDKLTIVQTKRADGELWGRFAGGWISLTYTNYNELMNRPAHNPVTTPEEEPEEDADNGSDNQESTENPNAVTGTVVNCDVLNIRSGAGFGYGVIGSLNVGAKVEITEQKDASGMTWGKISSGWISLSYVKLDEKTPDSDEESPEDTKEPETAEKVSGTVISTIPLNIRSAPGAWNARLGTYAPGTKIEILEQKPLNGQAWGRTDKGWVCMLYVRLDPADTGTDAPEPDDDSNTGNDSNESTGSEVGTVVSTIPLNIRTAPGTHNARVGTYTPGTRVTILEKKTHNGVVWGRTDKGWVSMDYVQLISTDGNGTSGGVMSGTVVSTTPLNIRSAPGTFNAAVGSYAPGTWITIYEHRVVSGQSWGRTEKGWVCLAYVKLDPTTPETEETTPETKPETDTEQTPETKPETDTEQTPETEPETTPEATPDSGASNTGTVVSYSPLNIRSAPGTFNPQVGTYARGTRITILEQKTVNGQVWGRTDKGWVCMSYVQMDSVNGDIQFTGTVNTNDLRIRSGAGTHNAILGYYNTGDRVSVYETAYVGVVAWGRTDKGWICLEYVDR